MLPTDSFPEKLIDTVHRLLKVFLAVAMGEVGHGRPRSAQMAAANATDRGQNSIFAGDTRFHALALACGNDLRQ
jgi:hypothetical protein